ncbi:MAG: sensor histidine kinase [Niabella sp.]|nr:sensor histidine kinase [Niabella sp.]
MPVENDKYQEVVIVVVACIILFWLITGGIIYFIIQYQRRKFRHLKEKADLQAAFEKDLLQSQIEIQEQAFNTISRELHDNIGQQLSLAKLNLNTLKAVSGQQDKNKIESSLELISNSIEQIRSISKTLLGEKISAIGVVEAIKNEAERLHKTGIFEVSFSSSLPAIPLPPQKEIILFRIVQEALNNTIKHAEATRVSLAIREETTYIKIFIQDNGKGFNLEEDNSSGIGLLNMRNRAQTIGAALNIDSTLHRGTTVEIIFQKLLNH